MADEAEETEEDTKKGSKLPLIIGLVLALVGGGGGFFAAQSGLLGGGEKEMAEEEPEEMMDSKELTVSFVPLDPVVISLPPGSGQAHLHFKAQLEVAPPYVSEVEALRPRIMDVLNGYLRATNVPELQDPTALIRLRGQMLRRVQVVTGEGRVSDLLIMEFVLS